MEELTLRRLWDNLGTYWEDYQKTSKVERFGQYICNRYIPLMYLPWPELFYEADDREAYLIIFKFLEDNWAYVPKEVE